MIRGRHIVRVVGLASVGLPLVATGAGVIGGVDVLTRFVVFTPAAVVFAIVGWLIAERQPGNWIGPLLLAFGLGVAGFIVADTYVNLPGPPPGAVLVAVLMNTLDAPLFIVVAIALVLFPDGRLPGAHWAWVFPLAVVASASAIVGLALLPGRLPIWPAIENPIGITGYPGLVVASIGYGGLAVLLLAGAVSLVTRWRMGNPLERAQIKWVGTAGIVLAGAQVVTIVIFEPGAIVTPATVVQLIAVTLVPAAMGIAILRHRLYDIDRIISRGLSYAIVVAVMSALFIAAILLFQAALAGITQGQSLAVAASTLLTYALFYPLRKRVREQVDRRFYRARYDAQQIAADFAERLRDEVDLITLRAELLQTTGDAVRPTGAALWLRSQADNR